LGSDPPKTEWAEAFEICAFFGEKIGRKALHTDGATTPQDRAILWGGSALFGSISIKRTVLAIHFQEDLPPLFDPSQFRGHRARNSKL
jgi:hypothetical protein